MKKLALFLTLLLITSAALAENALLTAKSPDHRVSLLALYTSEGCSSCPPADRFLSGLQNTGVTNQQLIPLAFHVTYWDYIGWKDPYASSEHDDRQRKIAAFDKRKTIYTPQFVFNGSDYRDYDNFSENVRRNILQIAKVDIEINAVKKQQELQVELKTDNSRSKLETIVYYLVLYENNLISEVDDGENEGKTLHHNYVVRKIHGPFEQNKNKKVASFEQTVLIEKDWIKNDLGLVAYAQNPKNGEILQSVELSLF